MSILRSWSLRNKLLLFAAALIVLPGTLFGVVSERTATESLQRTIGLQLAREAKHAADRVAAYVARERQTLSSFAQQDLMREVRVFDVDKRVSRALATLEQGSAARAGYVVVDRAGSPVAASRPELLRSAERWLAGLSLDPDARAPTLGPLDVGGRAEIVAMATPIPDPDGAAGTIGFLVGLYDWVALTEPMDALRADLEDAGARATVVLARDDGALLRISRAEDTDPLPDLGDGIEPGPAPERYVVDAAAGWIAGYAALDGSLTGWRLLVVEPLAVALAPVRRLQRRMLFVIGAALVGALAVAALASGRVTRPLAELTGAIRRLSAGGSPPLEVPVRSDDEVGTLARSFNRMASELERTQRHLVEAEKFAFVGELASGVAHQVRTSLGVLRSSTQIIERSLPEGTSAEASELSEMMRAEVDRLAGVVDDLLTLDRPRSLQPVPTPLAGPVGRAADFVEPRAREKRVSIVRRIPERSPVVLCDAEMIQQACVNLLVNAVQAVDEGGTVEVEIREPDPGAGTASFRVRDDGPGIPDDVRDRIFQPFVTQRKGGVGLGLTFVARTAHDHRGAVAIEPCPDGGACFRVDLPLAGGSS